MQSPVPPSFLPFSPSFLLSTFKINVSIVFSSADQSLVSATISFSQQFCEVLSTTSDLSLSSLPQKLVQKLSSKHRTTFPYLVYRNILKMIKTKNVHFMENNFPNRCPNKHCRKKSYFIKMNIFRSRNDN